MSESAKRKSRKPAEPLYQVLKRDIEEMIRKGRLKPGERVPSESELIARYRVSNTTARRCLDELQAAGWLERKRGKGTFVSRLANVLHRDRVALVIKDILSLAHPFLGTVAGTLERTLEQAGIHVFIVRANPSNQPLNEGLHLSDLLMHEDCHHAIILSNLPLRTLEPLVEQGIKCLGVNVLYLDERIPYIANDFKASKQVCFEELAARGHRRIAVLVEEPSLAEFGVLNSTALVLRAYSDARNRFPELEPQPLVCEIGSIENLAPKLREIMGSGNPPTALACWDELAALDVIRCLSDLSLRVPADVSVVGSKLLPCSHVACVEQPLEQMATLAAEAMLEWMKGNSPQNTLLAPVKFLPRETICAAPVATLIS